MNTKNRQENGFTLIELVVVVALVAIVSMMAVPAMRSMLLDNRQVARTNEVLLALSLARSEAIKRGRVVTVCASADQSTCDTDAWEQGWIVFQDTDENGERDAAAEQLILAQSGFVEPNTTLRTNGLADAGRIQFGRNGASVEAGEASFTLCDLREEEYAKGIVVEAIGRAYVAGDSNDDGIPDNKNGENLSCV